MRCSADVDSEPGLSRALMKRRASILDRVLRWFGYSKRAPAAIYEGAQFNRLTLDWVSSLISADQEIRGNARVLRARARDLQRNNPIAKNYLNLLAANVVGDKGVVYQSKVRNNSGELNRAMNDKIEAAWQEWGQVGNCTVDGKLSFRGVQDLAMRTIAQDGETFIRMVPGFANKYGLALQIIDADQVDVSFDRLVDRGQNEIRMGVEVDTWGRPVAYWVNPKPLTELGGSMNRERIDARFMFHLYDPARVNQTRGITWFHPVMAQLKMLAGYIEAELVAARTGAAKMGWLRYTDPSAYVQPNPDAEKQAPAYTLEANPGMIETLPPGMEFVAWNPDHPANAFQQFVITLLRQVATGLGVSYNALASDLVGVNYSSMRSGLLIERDLWRRLQSFLIESFLTRLFSNWMDMALLSGALVLDSRDPARFLEGMWQPRGWQWVDPLKDIQAAGMALDLGLTSRTEVLADQGQDVETIFDQLSEEQKLAKEKDIELLSISKPPKPITDPTKAVPEPGADDSEDQTPARLALVGGKR